MLETADPAASAPPPRIWPVYAVTAILLVGMVVFAGSVVTGLAVLSRRELLGGGVLPGGEAGAFREFYATLPGFLATAAVSVTWIGVVTLVIAVLSPVPLAARLGWAPARLTAAGWVLAVLGGLALSQGIDLAFTLSGLGRGGPLELMIEVLSHARGTGLVAAVLIVGVGAGVVEELFFRGYAQRRLVARHGAPVGIAISAALFALAHGDLRHSGFAFCFGLFVGAVAHWSDSTRPAIAVHVVNNVVSVLTIAGGFADLEQRASRLALAFACAVLFAGAFAGARGVRREAARWTATRALG